MSKKKNIMYRSFYLLIGLILLLLFIAPGIIKNYTIHNSKELLGRQIDIGKIKYNYFSSTLKVYDFKMFEKNDTDAFTTFDTLILNIEPYRFVLNQKVVEQFYVKGLMVKTVMKDAVFNFDDLIAFHSSDSITDNEPESFKYEISNIELKDASFYFDNQVVGKETHIENFSFLIPNISWNQEQKSNADVKFKFENGGYLESSLNINPVDGDFDALLTTLH